MFCQPPDEESQIVQSGPPSKKIKKPKKKKNKKRGIKKDTKKKQPIFATTMSAWAQNFAVAATWQLKHQVAYWKARAKALEYENKVLHDVIRRNNLTVRSRTNTESEFRSDSDDSESESEDDDENEQDNGLEVSEEFIQFLTANAKFKEDAKRERERLKAKIEEENKIVQEQPRETSEESRERMKELYGDKSKRISALEMSLLSSFIHDSDKTKPIYWPNIPLNL